MGDAADHSAAKRVVARASPTTPEQETNRTGSTRREFIEGGLGLTVLNTVPGVKHAFAQADENDRIIVAARGLPTTELRGMIWSPYSIPMQSTMQEFKAATGIGVGGIQDISIFDIPQRAMAVALSKSPQFDFFHVDAGMIPSLSSAGLIERLDQYMKKANFRIDAVGDYAKQSRRLPLRR